MSARGTQHYCRRPLHYFLRGHVRACRRTGSYNVLIARENSPPADRLHLGHVICAQEHCTLAAALAAVLQRSHSTSAWEPCAPYSEERRAPAEEPMQACNSPVRRWQRIQKQPVGGRRVLACNQYVAGARPVTCVTESSADSAETFCGSAESPLRTHASIPLRECMLTLPACSDSLHGRFASVP